MDLASLLPKPRRELTDNLLDRLEKKEYAALVWGFTEGAFTESELDAEAQFIAGHILDTPSQVWEALHDQGLLLRLRQPAYDGEKRYRTRFAETIRLLFHLRQLFPPRRPDALPTWVGAKTLVADYRLVRKPRRYPKRDLNRDAVLQGLQDIGQPLRERRAVEAFLEPNMRLARFQLDATRRILGARNTTEHQGTIICAGTGTGKTLAFYLPVFARLTGLVQAGVHDTLCLAIYPRNELLKDQFRTAYKNARRLDGKGDRKLRIGVYYGDTVSNVRALVQPLDYVRKQWPERKQGQQVIGRACPFLRCPDCEGELMWRSDDYNRAQPIERLWCGSCSAVTVPADTIVLTRDTMHSQPPDILFTTTEMLNRSLCERERNRMLGVGTNKLRFVLLDEAHTYSGVTGAQNALVLRRWKYAANAPCHFVGLSATLREPRRFFAQLIGEPEGRIEALSARDEDMEEEGWEYQLALRGDSGAQASLLSTSVQTVMLLARMLDPMNDRELSEGRFPPKLFAFTDNLDVANRFYHTLRDAENFKRRRTDYTTMKLPLALERRDTWEQGRPWPDAIGREKHGQVWSACTELGNELSLALGLDKVNSQDSGVDGQAKVIVATSSLEVGYDDSGVGAIIQHKAARGAASFLQRKGRAGRLRTAHPWTVVVLSDYGRDRVAYQGYEQLFEPELDRTDLPVNNRYVLKIQAALALIDFIGQTIQGNYNKHWSCLSTRGKYKPHQERIRNIAHGILTVPWKRKQFREYLQQALGIDEEQATALLWQSPRSLMAEVLPTLIRRMDTDFAGDYVSSESGGAGEGIGKTPLPEFITANLFSNLLVPEVDVAALRPARERNPTPEYTETQGVLSALQQTAPGRVTRRYAVSKAAPSNHWIPPGYQADETIALMATLPNAPHLLPLDKYLAVYEPECQSQWQDPNHDKPETITVYRPRRMELVRAEEADLTNREWVDNQSRTDLVWHSQIHPTAAPDEQSITVAAHIGLSRWISRVRFFCFSTGNPLRTQRFAVGSTGTLYIKPIINSKNEEYGPTEKRAITVSFVEKNNYEKRAAVGFETDVDAVGFSLALPDALLGEVLAESIAELRAPYFVHLVRSSGIGESSFDRDWFAQTALSIFTAVAHSNDRSLETVVQSYTDDELTTKERWRKHVTGALDAIFQVAQSRVPSQDTSEPVQESELGEEDYDTDGSGDTDATGDAPLQRQRLEASLCQNEVRHTLIECGKALYEAPSPTWYPWLHNRLRATLGAALLSACEAVSVDFNTAELYLDIAPGVPSQESDLSHDEQSHMVWISESIPGGAGVIEEVRRVIRHEEERFFLLVGNALQGFGANRLHKSLRRILDLAANGPVQTGLANVREAMNGPLAVFNTAREALLDVLRQNDVALSHSVTNALNVRILHPSSSGQTDALLHRIFQEWEQTEARLQTEIDARVFAYLALQTPEIKTGVKRFLASVGDSQSSTAKQMYNAVYAMLWPKGYVVRDQAAESYNPFAPLPSTDSLLLERRMASWHTQSEVRGMGSNAIFHLTDTLRTYGITEWIVPEQERKEARDILLTLLRTPIICGLLIGYARVERVARRMESGEVECLSFTLTLPEAGYL